LVAISFPSGPRRSLIIVIEFAKLRLKCFRPSLATWHPFIVWLFVCQFACLLSPPFLVLLHRSIASGFGFWLRFPVSGFGFWFAVHLIVCLFGGAQRLSIAVFIAILASMSSFIEYEKNSLPIFGRTTVTSKIAYKAFNANIETLCGFRWEPTVSFGPSCFTSI